MNGIFVKIIFPSGAPTAVTFFLDDYGHGNVDNCVFEVTFYTEIYLKKKVNFS